MTELHFVPAASNLLAVMAEPRMSESVIAPPFTPALIIGLCVAAGLATWLALPSKREVTLRRLGAVALGAIGLIGAALMVRWTVDQGGMSVYFWLFSAVALFASVRVITHNKPVYSALYFVLTVFATGGLFVLLWAEFIAAALVLIYAGAILITYVFVIMLASESLTGGTGDASTLVSDHDGRSRDPFLAALTGFAVTGLLIYVLFDKSAALDRNQPALSGDYSAEYKALESSPALREFAGQVMKTWSQSPAEKPSADLGSAQMLGQELIDNQALNVQLAAVILTVAMVGAITLARRRVIVAEPTGGHEMVNTPATPVDDNPKSINRRVRHGQPAAQGVPGDLMMKRAVGSGPWAECGVEPRLFGCAIFPAHRPLPTAHYA